MKTFRCQRCGQSIYFENSQCTQCGATLGFLPDQMRLSALIEGDGGWIPPEETTASASRPRRARAALAAPRLIQPVAAMPKKLYRKCGNYEQHDICNWMVPADEADALCPACRPNQVIPNLTRPGNLDKWFRIECSKRRLFYGLMRLELPVRTKSQNPEGGLAFAFCSSEDAAPDETVTTGHADGLITINLNEADPAERERTRMDMDEKYRTLLGHFRHEIGHYYWDLLIRDGGRLESFRALFGDEQTDYAEAMNAYYANGASVDWQDRYISAYASMHPWEDWAETWAHYLHIVDTLETCEHFGVRVSRPLPGADLQGAEPDFDPYRVPDVEPIVANWVSLTFALNSINRSMGLQDLYPFVMSQPVIDKLAYVHRSSVRKTRDRVPARSAAAAALRASRCGFKSTWIQANRRAPRKES